MLEFSILGLDSIPPFITFELPSMEYISPFLHRPLITCPFGILIEPYPSGYPSRNPPLNTLPSANVNCPYPFFLSFRKSPELILYYHHKSQERIVVFPFLPFCFWRILLYTSNRSLRYVLLAHACIRQRIVPCTRCHLPI